LNLKEIIEYINKKNKNINILFLLGNNKLLPIILMHTILTSKNKIYMRILIFSQISKFKINNLHYLFIKNSNFHILKW